LGISRSVIVLAAAYAAALLWVSRDFTVDYWDAIQTISSGLRVLGERPDQLGFSPTRPPFDWLFLLVPLKAGLLAGLSPAGLLRLCRAAMTVLPAALAVACWRRYRKDVPAAAAGAAALALALNPLVVRYAPFCLFDLFGALWALPVIDAGWRYLEDPRRKTFAVFLALYAGAVLARYQLCLLALPALAFLLRPKNWRAAPGLAALLPAAYLLAAGFMALALRLAVDTSLPSAAVHAHREMSGVFFFNEAKPWAPASVYGLSLWRQLGPAFLALTLAGLWSWASSRKPESLYRAAAAVLPLFALTFGIANKEERYLLAYLPLVYAAAAEGLALLKARPAALAVCAALFPWAACRDSWVFLARERALRSPAPEALAAALEAKTAPGECVRWSAPELPLKGTLKAIASEEQYPLLAAPSAQFWVRRRLSEHDSCPAEVAHLSPDGLLY
jgi:hypothetical protein